MNRITQSLIISGLIFLTLIPDSNAQRRKKGSVEPAPEIQATLYKNLKYRSVGPSRGGRATAITGIPSKPYTFFMGPTGGGVWKTSDAGTTWRNISDGQIKAGSIGAITVAPSDVNVIYVGTGSTGPRGNVSSGIGMYKSNDGGENWEFMGLPDAGQIGKVVVHPNNPDLVYVAALGNIFKPNSERGVFRSMNGGQSWEKVLFISDSTGAIDLAINPENPRIMYAAMWRAERKPWTLIDGGQEGGIWQTKDGGTTWKKLGGGLPTGVIGRIGLALSPANPQRIWAQIQAKEEEKGGLYRTDNGGKSWTRINRDHKLRQRGWYYSHVDAHPTDENTVYASNTGFYKSIDGGKTFDIRLRTKHGDNHGVWINPNNPDIMINCNDGGANISLNGGKTWSTQQNQPTSEFYRISLDNDFPYRLYAGQQDNTTISVPSHNPGALTATGNWISVGGGESADVAVNPTNSDIIYATTYSGEITYLDRSKGYVRQVTAYPHYTEGTEQRDLKYRWQWNFPVTVNPHNTNEVYMTSNYVHKSTDQGQTWQILSPDLTNDIDKYQGIPGGPVQHDATGVEVYSSIFAFEISPHQDGEFWAGSDDGLIHISRDNGDSWQNITPPNMPIEGTVNKIELSASTPGRALVAVYRYRDGDPNPYIFKTDDYGSSWQLITSNNGIPSNHFVRAVAEDPINRNLIFAGTEFGMYVSFNGGSTWKSFQLNLPHVPITDMEIKNDDLALSTQGRAFWILDDISYLRELTTTTHDETFKLFTPRTAYRTQLWDSYSPEIKFYLKTKPDSTDKVELRIHDKSGEEVMKFIASGENSQKTKVRTFKQGMNSITWNMTYPGPELVSDLVTMVIGNPARGPWAPPGTYTAELVLNEDSQQVEFEIQKDPRWDMVSQADFDAQFDFISDVSKMVTDAHELLEELRSIRSQVKAISQRAMDAGFSEEIKTQAKDLSESLTEIEDMIIQTKAESSQDNINYPRVFSNHIGRLYSVSAYSHGRPTGGMLERWEDIKLEYRAIEEAYAKVKNNDVPTFTKLLEENNVSRIIISTKE